MTIWLTALTTLMKQQTHWLRWRRWEGSGPREPGAKMVLTALAQFDNIGGGHLELRVIDIVRKILVEKIGLSCERRLNVFRWGHR